MVRRNSQKKTKNISSDKKEAETQEPGNGISTPETMELSSEVGSQTTDERTSKPENEKAPLSCNTSETPVNSGLSNKEQKMESEGEQRVSFSAPLESQVSSKGKTILENNGSAAVTTLDTPSNTAEVNMPKDKAMRQEKAGNIGEGINANDADCELHSSASGSDKKNGAKLNVNPTAQELKKEGNNGTALEKKVVKKEEVDSANENGITKSTEEIQKCLEEGLSQTGGSTKILSPDSNHDRTKELSKQNGCAVHIHAKEAGYHGCQQANHLKGNVIPVESNTEGKAKESTDIAADNHKEPVTTDGMDNNVQHKAVNLGDEDSIKIYEKLKNDFVKVKADDEITKDNGVCKSDSISDYKTAIDDFDVLASSDIEGAVVINVPDASDAQGWSVSKLSEAFKETIKYMKYREALRYYGKDNQGYSYTTCIITLMIFAILAFGGMALGKIVDTMLNYAEGGELMPIERCLLGKVKDSMIICFFPVLILSAFNMYILGNRRFYKMVTLVTWLFSTLIPILFFIHVYIMWKYQFDTSTSFALILVAMGQPDLASADDMCFYGGMIFLYNLTLVFMNLCLIVYRLVMPQILVGMVNRDVRRLRVIHREGTSVALPVKHLSMDRPETTKVTGHFIRIQQTGKLEFPWRILSFLTSEQVIGIDPYETVYQYTGQLNCHLKPHGYGVWQSTTPNGEVLAGYWENGIPLGCFRSRENNMYTEFSNILVGWAKCIYGKEMIMGVASVESCQSKSISSTFPRVTAYKAESLESGIKPGLNKYIGVPGSNKKNECQHCYGHYRHGIVMRLADVSNDLKTYKFDCEHPCVERLPDKGILNERLKALTDNKEDKKGYKDYVGSILQATETNSPSFLSHEPTEVRISMDSVSHLYVDGFSPLERCVEQGLSSIHSRKDDKVTVEIAEHGDVMREIPDAQILLRRRWEETFAVNGWKKRGCYKKPEVVIYITGNKDAPMSALERAANVFTSCDYPQYVKFIVFSWADRQWSERITHAFKKGTIENAASCFQDFLKSLLDAGICDIHLIVEQTGADLFLASFVELTKGSEQHPLLRNVYTAEQQNVEKINILSITLLFPNHDLGEFVKNAYKEMRRFCELITVFGRKETLGCWFTRLVNGSRCISNNIRGLWVDSTEAAPQGIFMKQEEDDAHATLGMIQLPRLMPQLAAGNAVNGSKNDSKIWLDMDCIDVTWIPKNCKNIQPYPWYMTKEISEDLRDLILSRKRAKDRVSRLDQVNGNVWVYRNLAIGH